jgi:DNA-binding XRE family transcriptional regulator
MGRLVPKADNIQARRATIRRERDAIHEHVISVFRGARQDADLTQEEAADLVGWSKDVIVNFENNRRDLGVADLILFCEKAAIDPAELFERVLFYRRTKRSKSAGSSSPFPKR